jgi:hypothetical protein
LHRRRVGPGVGLGVTDGELHFVAQDLGQELLFQFLAAVPDDRLAHDADPFADLGSAPAGQGLVQEVLVDAVALLAPVLLGPGDAQPPLLTQQGHERPSGRGVDDLGHVLPGDVEDLGVLVLVEEPLHLSHESELLGRELEIHSSDPPTSSDPRPDPPRGRDRTRDRI